MNKKILSVVLILCVMLAVMPMTAYAADIAFCSKCNRIQTVRLTYQYSNDEWHICNVTCTVCNNIWFYGMSHKWSGTATCTSGRTCTECGGSSEPLGHDWGTWTQNSDEKTHTRICKCDASHTETENCHGGTATCTHKAVCAVCGGEYGELDPKNHTNLKHFPAKAATKTTEGNIEYWYCSGCKKYYKDATATQEIKQADTVTAKLSGGTVKPGADKSPQTGDNPNFLLWMALLFVSGGAAIGTTVVSKKRKYNK